MWRALLFMLFFAPFTIACSIAAILGTRLDPTGAVAHRCARFWSRYSLAAARVKVTATGLEHIPAQGPVIYMGNHQGNFDILAVTIAIPRRFSWLAKAELFRIPVFGGAMRRAGYIPLERGDGRQALRSIGAAVRMIAAGTSVVVFPEGTWTRDGALLPFKPGSFLLASRAGVPVVPFTIDGSLRINPPRRFALRAGGMSITFAPPIQPEGTGILSRRALEEKVRTAITQGLDAV